MKSKCCTHPDWIFVFGSNEAGRHGAGAAKHAMLHHGAVYGVGEGFQAAGSGNRQSYAIPTKDRNLHTLTLFDIGQHVDIFIDAAIANPDLTFYITRVGCGLAGYTDDDIAPMFKGAPENCVLPEGWR